MRSVSHSPGNETVYCIAFISAAPPPPEGRPLLPRTIPTEVPYTSQWSEYQQTLHLARIHKQTPPSGTRYRAGQSSQRPRSPPQSPACRPFHLRIRMLGRSAAVPSRSIAYTPEEPDDARWPSTRATRPGQLWKAERGRPAATYLTFELEIVWANPVRARSAGCLQV